MRGRALTPSDPGYAAEVAAFDLTGHDAPVAVSPESTDDVVATLRLARDARLPVTVAGGGHASIPPVPVVLPFFTDALQGTAPPSTC